MGFEIKNLIYLNCCLNLIKMSVEVSSPLNDSDSDEETELLWNLSEFALNLIPLSSLAMLTSDEIFGDKIDDLTDDLILSQIVDENQPLQSELAIRISILFKSKGMKGPDQLIFQVLKRLAGSHPDGKYISAISLCENQIVVVDGEEHVLTPGAISPISKKIFVPRNKTLINFPDGRSTLKSKDYTCLMVWAFWTDNPEGKNT